MRKEFPRNTGMLVVTEVLPGSPSEKVLQPGDILVRLNGHYVGRFEPLEEALDDTVGGEVEVELERGGKSLSAKLPVGDLHAITPSAYAEFGDAVVNTLSYQQARHLNVPTRGVYVANPGYVFSSAGVPRGAVMLALNGKKTDALKDFEAGIAQLGDGERASVRYLTIEASNSTRAAHHPHGPAVVPGASLRAQRHRRAVGLPRPAARSGAQAGGGERDAVPALPGCAHERARPLARHGDLRHAVLGVGHHRAQLPRHRARRRCAARPGGRRPQHRAGGGRGRHHHVRRHRAGPRAGGVRASAARLRRRRLRPEAHRQHAGARRTPVHPRDRERRARLGGRTHARQRAARAQHRDRQHRSARAAAVAHHALPRQQHRDRAAGQPAERIRRRARRQRRQRAGHLVELRLRERPRDRPGYPRRAHPTWWPT